MSGVRELARTQSDDLFAALGLGVRVIDGWARVAPGLAGDGRRRIHVTCSDTSGSGCGYRFAAATGARARSYRRPPPDGHRILTWTQLYHLDELRVTSSLWARRDGALNLRALITHGAQVTLVSSRDRLILPGEDAQRRRDLHERRLRRTWDADQERRSGLWSVRSNDDGVVDAWIFWRMVEDPCLMAVGLSRIRRDSD